MNNPGFIKTASFILLLLFAQKIPAFEAIEPATACNLLKQENFRGSMQYSQKNSGIYACTSLRKPVNRGEPTGSDMRYEVLGTETETSKVLLHLRMRSHRSSVPVLKEFERISSLVYRKLSGDSLPEAISMAIVSAIRGEWVMQDHVIRLQRLHDRAMTYELILSIGK